jgi:hypothetical protein
MRIEPELGVCSIVLLGHFNPLIFSPLWFAQNKIVSETEAADAEISVIHPQVTLCKIGKFQIQAELNRFAADTAEAPWVDLLDFVTRTFSLLIHTPINQMGINRLVHFSVGSEATRNRIGNLLAPLEPWGAWGAEIAKTKMDGRHGGCMDVTMLQPKAPGPISGHLQVQVQPSTKVKGDAGIYVHVNDHHTSGPLDKTIGCEVMIAELAKNFEASIRRSEELIDQVMSLKERV